MAPSTRLHASTLGVAAWVAAAGLAACGTAQVGTVSTGVSGPPPIAVRVTPSTVSLAPEASYPFAATVTGTLDLRISWSVAETFGGTIDPATGLYQAPAGQGTFHVVATSQADTTKKGIAAAVVSPPSSIDPTGLIPPDRTTAWIPGLMAVGGIPNRATVCATVDAGAYGNGTADASAGIQAAINGCPAGQVVQLSPGTFLVNSFLLIDKGITLRGAGPTLTTLSQTTGADKDPSRVSDPAFVQQPIIQVGPNRWPTFGNSTNLAADAVKGTYAVTVASTAGLQVGDVVLIDELVDGNLIYYHPNDLPAGYSWFMRYQRPLSEWKEIVSISGSTVTFNTPFHTGYRVSQAAQLTPMAAGSKHVRYAGVEDLKVRGGGEGNISLKAVAYSWVRNVDSTYWAVDPGVRFVWAFRSELRDSFLHDGEHPFPGGAGYAMSFESGTSDTLFENSISTTTIPPASQGTDVIGVNKVMVFRAAGAGCVVGYNYVDNGIVGYNFAWQEVGVNGSHMCGNHHALFEGNHGFNADGDNTHGNQIFHTFYRNHLTGRRSLYDPVFQHRAFGMMAGNWWMSAVGNVLGYPGVSGPLYESTAPPWPDAIWKLGYNPENWAAAADPKVLSTILRHGNFDYVTGKVAWDPSISKHTLPSSLYLTQKPGFFGAGSGYTWPWVDPLAATPALTLPAKARYDAGTPFTQP